MAGEWPTIRLGDYVDASLGKMLDAKKQRNAETLLSGELRVATELEV
jgi:hypothetical protein